MAADNDTSKLRRSRRNQPQAPATREGAASTAAANLPPPPAAPRTLEEAIENVRMLTMQMRGVLHCLSDVLLYSDDDDAVMHAEVARATAGWARLAAVELDLAKLRPLIEAIRQGGGGDPGEGEPDLTNHGRYQVREPRPVYWA